MKDDFQLKFKNFLKELQNMPNGLFRFVPIKNSKTCETGCFVKHKISRNGQLVSLNNKTRFASSFAKQEAKQVSLVTL
jgi:hypothetical protein